MRKNLLTIFLASLLLLFTAGVGSAYAASLNYSPNSGTRNVGSTFSVNVNVNTAGVATNSYQADIRFPADKLEITAISTGGSICTLYPFQPSYNNSAGTAQIQCGLPSPGYNGSSGKIGSVSFRAKSAGSATVSFASSSQVLANDGAGTNVLTSLGTANFSLVPPPTSAPAVSSSTHPAESSWYKARDLVVSWAGGYSGYSYELNQVLETIPDQVSEGSGTNKSYPSLGEGVWYFHLRGNGTGGWSGTTHFRIQIDFSSPDPFQPVSDPVGESDRRPLISFQTTDGVSGIDHYEIKFDSGEFIRAENPYKPERISSGEHTITVRAYDKAGNFTDGTTKIRIKEIPSPIITKPTGGYLKFLEKLQVEGTAKAGTVVALYLNDKPVAQEITVGKDGHWQYEYTELMMPGVYKLYAVVTSDGIESRPSNEVKLTVDAATISIGLFNLPAPLVILALLIILAIVIAGSGYLLWHAGHRVYYAAGNFKERIRGLREDVAEDMTKLEHQVERDVEDTLQDADSAKMRNMEHALENRVEKDIEATKDHLKGDIDKAEGELGKP